MAKKPGRLKPLSLYPLTTAGKAEPVTSEEFLAFDRLMRKLIAVPKKALDKKVAAFKRRKKKRAR